MSSLLSQIRRLNGIGDRMLAEPFAGGAGASLTLLFQEENPEIFINDADPAIHDFWWAAVNRTTSFIQTLNGTRISMAEWYRQRDTYRSSGRQSRLRRGFAAFYLNRCNRSGIIVNGGPIGGIRQTGEWGLKARFNKAELRRRFERIAEYRDRIHVSGDDGIDFIGRIDPASTMFFIDPPYFIRGETLYLNVLSDDYHIRLRDLLKSLRNEAWVLTYDDCPQVRKLYRDWSNLRPFTLRYSAGVRRGGREVLIAPKWMRLPPSQSSDSIAW